MVCVLPVSPILTVNILTAYHRLIRDKESAEEKVLGIRWEEKSETRFANFMPC